jgi:hypothetical protein
MEEICSQFQVKRHYKNTKGGIKLPSLQIANPNYQHSAL